MSQLDVKLINKIRLRLNRAIFSASSLLRKYFLFRMPNGDRFNIRHEGQIARDIFTNTFEKSEVRLIIAALKPGAVFVDVGANIGFYSLIASRCVGASGRVISFEPSKETFSIFKENVKLNKFSSNIQLNNFGLGHIENEELILRRDVGYGDAEKYIAPEAKYSDCRLPNVAAMDESEVVKVTTLDSLFERKEVPVVDFMKLDTEGFELFVLQGARKTIANSRNIVLMLECTKLGTERAGYTQQDVANFLSSCGLNLFYYDEVSRKFRDDEAGLLIAGNVWASSNENNLPHVNQVVR